MQRWFVWLSLALVVLLAGCSRKQSRRPDASSGPAPSSSSAAVAHSATGSAGGAVLDGSAAVAVAAGVPSVAHIDGESLLRLIREGGGRGALVNIWATWCGPCRRELPMLRSVAENVKARGLALLLVSVDEPESEPEVRRMLELEGYAPPYYVARRPLGVFKSALHPGWPGMIPVTFLFDAAGKRRYFWGGPVHDHELIPIIDGFLAGDAIDGEARFELAPGQTTQ